MGLQSWTPLNSWKTTTHNNELIQRNKICPFPLLPSQFLERIHAKSWLKQIQLWYVPFTNVNSFFPCKTMELLQLFLFYRWGNGNPERKVTYQALWGQSIRLPQQNSLGWLVYEQQQCKKKLFYWCGFECAVRRLLQLRQEGAIL